jgi:hypothetical protein
VSVSDPNSLIPDPDPAFKAEYCSGSGSRSGDPNEVPDRVLMTKNWKKFTAEKKFNNFFDQKLQFSYS